MTEEEKRKKKKAAGFMGQREDPRRRKVKTNYIRGNVAGAWGNGESGVSYPYFRH